MRVFLALEDHNLCQRVAILLHAEEHEVVEIADSREMLLRLIAARDLSPGLRPAAVVSSCRISREIALPRLLSVLGMTGWSIPVLLVGPAGDGPYRRRDRVLRYLDPDFSLSELRRALWELGLCREELPDTDPSHDGLLLRGRR